MALGIQGEEGLSSFIVLFLGLSKVLRTFEPEVQHRAVSPRVSQDILILAWLWRQCEGWCPLGILADTGQTKELFVLDQSPQPACTQKVTTELSWEVWECKAHQLAR